MGGPGQLHPVIGRMQCQPGARGDPGDIGNIADDIACPGQSGGDFGRNQRLVARP